MAHGVRIGGTGYGISGGRTRVGGTEYVISGGKTRVDGTEYGISFSQLIPIHVINSYGTEDSPHGYLEIDAIGGTRIKNKTELLLEPGTDIEVFGRSWNNKYTMAMLNGVMVGQQTPGAVRYVRLYIYTVPGYDSVRSVTIDLGKRTTSYNYVLIDEET